MFIIIGLRDLPALGIVALGVDYSVTLTAKAKLDTAADAAAVAGVVAAKNCITTRRDRQSQRWRNRCGERGRPFAIQLNTGTTANLGSLNSVSPSFTILGNTINGSISYNYTTNILRKDARSK